MTSTHARTRTLPTFLVIGAMKSGTSSLARMLNAHPDVFMSQPKELHYFVESRNWSLGQQWYEEQFAAGAGCQAIGEAAVTYSQMPISDGVPERMSRTVPDARLIYLVRHPIERMLSHYRHALADGYESRPPDEALQVRPDYLDFSCYAKQLSYYYPYYSPEQILVVQAERYFQHPQEVLAQIYAFIGVDPQIQAPQPEVNTTGAKRAPVGALRTLRRVPGAAALGHRLSKPTRERVKRLLPQRPISEQRLSLSPSVRAELEERIRPDVRRLRELVGDDVDGWGLC